MYVGQEDWFLKITSLSFVSKPGLLHQTLIDQLLDIIDLPDAHINLWYNELGIEFGIFDQLNFYQFKALGKV